MNNLQFDSSMAHSYSRESLNKIEEVGENLVNHIDTTKILLTGLNKKFEKMQILKSEKPVPNSFLIKRNIQIEKPVRNIHKFPLLFPKEKPSSSTEESEHIDIASLFKEPEEAGEKEQKNTETQILPIYEPLEHRFFRYSAPDIEGKGKMPEAHTFHPDSHREWNIDNMSIGQIH